MAAVPNDELNKAVEIWLYLKTTNPSWITDYINKYNGGRNPFAAWPPEKEEVDKFLLAANQLFRGAKEAEIIAKTIDPKKRQELVEEFDREFEKVKNARSAAEVAAKKRVQEVIKYTLEEPSVPANQEPLLFQILAKKSEREPQRTVAELVPEAIEVGEVAQAFLNPRAGTEASGPTSFKNLRGLNTVQKNITAAGVDALTVMFPDLRRGAFDRMIGNSLQKMLANTDFLTKKFGSDFLAQPWFTQVQRDAGRMVGQGTAHGGAKNALEDVISSLFRGPADQTTLAIMEVYRVNVMEGLPPPNFNQLRAAHMGIGSELFRFGVGEAKGWAIQKGLAAVGVKVAAGTVGGPVSWAALAFDFAAGKLGKLGRWLKGLAVPGAGEVPGDRWILGVGCGAILLIFFILPIVTQLNIDSALITRLQMAGGGEGEGEIVGPIAYTGPPASGPLQCLNFNVSPKQFGDVAAKPFSSGQGNIVNGAVNAFPQLGVYNCLIQCPQKKINMYSGGPSSWWGWAPSANPGNLIVYDGFFAASGGMHAQARLLAHELAHEWAYTSPNVIDQFQQEGYCGKLCTYPSGKRGACSKLETLDETFAESAAMYITGENLQSLCPKGQGFMDKMFRSCGGGL